MQNILWGASSKPPKRNYSSSPKPTRTRQNLITSLEQKFSYRDIQQYTDICFQSAPRMQFLGVKKWCNTIFFLTANRNMFSAKLLRSERLLAFCRSILFLIAIESIFVKWVKFFERNCIVKWVIFLANFCLAGFAKFCLKIWN